MEASRERRLIGSGGFGEVYACRDASGREVAVKRLRERSAASLKRFQREAELQRELGFAAGFVPVLDFGEDAEGPYLVMPYLSGGNLKDRLAQGPPPLPLAVSWALTLSQALGRAHARGIVHRDIKPENVLFDDLDRPLLSDLGVARLHAGGQGNLTRTGELVGTYGRMAPEQLDDAREAGPPADVFALAALLYELLTGLPPFPMTGGLVDLVAAVCSGRFEDPRVRCPSCPPALAALITENLDPEPARRLPDAQAFAEALAAIDLYGRAEGSGGEARRRLAVAACGLLLIALSLTVWSLWPERWEPRPPSADIPEAPGPAPSQTPRPLPAFLRASRDPYAALREAPDLTLIDVLGENPGAAVGMVSWLEFSPCGRILASASLSEELVFWELATGRRIAALPCPRHPFILRFTPDGRGLVAGGEGGWVQRWDLETGELRRDYGRGAETVKALHITRDGRLFAGSKRDLRVWRLEDDAEVTAQHAPAGIVASALVPIPGSEDLLAASRHELVRFDPRTGDVESRWAVEAPDERDEVITGLACTLGGGAALVGLNSGRMKVWSFDDSQPRPTFQVAPRGDSHRQLIRSIAPLPDGRRALVAGEGALRIVELATGRVTATMEGHLSWTHALALHPDGERFASGGNDAMVALRTLAGARLWPAATHRGAIVGLATTAGGRQLISASRDGLVLAWDLVTREAEPLTSVPETEEIWGCAASRDGRNLAVGVAGAVVVSGLAERSRRPKWIRPRDGPIVQWLWCGSRLVGLLERAVVVCAFPGEAATQFELGVPLRGLVAVDDETCAVLREDGRLALIDLRSGRETVLPLDATLPTGVIRGLAPGLYLARSGSQLRFGELDAAGSQRFSSLEVDGGILSYAGVAPMTVALAHLSGKLNVLRGTSRESWSIPIKQSGEVATSLSFGQLGQELFVGTSLGRILRIRLLRRR